MDTYQVRIKEGRITDLIPAALIIAAIFISITYLTIFDVNKGKIVAVIFPPWVSSDAAFSSVANTGASIVRLGLSGQIIVAQPENESFEEEIKSAGAWAVVNPLGFGGCGTGIKSISKPATGSDVIMAATTR